MESQKRTAPGKPFRSGGQFRKPGDKGPNQRINRTSEGGYRRNPDRFKSGENRFQRSEGKDRFGKFGSQKAGRPSSRDKFSRDQAKAKGPKIHSDLQITDGKFRGKMLKNSASAKSIVIDRKLREIMLRLVSRRIRAGRFLDLSAGSGIMGAEALSRGGMLASFVEKSARLLSFITSNMSSLGIKEGHFEKFNLEVIPFLKRMEKKKRKWDVVFYWARPGDDSEAIINFLSRGVCLRHRGAFVIGHHAEVFFPEKIGLLHRWRVLVEGESAMSFYERK